ncbi:uncharacterized protein LOC127253950 isoform X2 [Andrographis paniculata]|nr:uncharacterized protein LOC127253950 isoform X2 [Andrographis paniculata]
MENQAQKVGVCVKKFYSEVMENLLPPSCVDPVKESTNDLSLNPYDRTDVNKKPLPSIWANHGSLEKKLNEDRVISDMISEKESSTRRCSDSADSPDVVSPAVSMDNKLHEPFCGKSKKLGAYRRRIGIKRNSQDDHPANDSSRVTSVLGNRNTDAVSLDMRSSSLTAFANTTVKPFSTSDKKCVKTVKENEPKDDNSPALSESKTNLSAKILWQNEDDSEHVKESIMKKNQVSDYASTCRHSPTQYTGESTDETSVPMLGSSMKTNACSVESEAEPIGTNEGKSMLGGSSDMSSNMCNVEFRDEDDTMCDEDEFKAELITNEQATGSSLDNFDPFEDANLDNSCVLVEGYKLCSHPQETKTRISYKNKIRRALSSKLRSTRKYDRFVSTQDDSGLNENADTSSFLSIPGLRSPSELDDWELL